MTCKEAVALLADYLEATLASDPSHDLEKHIEQCPPCQAYVNTYRKTTELGQQAGHVEMPEEMKRHLREFLLKQLGRAKS